MSNSLPYSNEKGGSHGLDQRIVGTGFFDGLLHPEWLDTQGTQAAH